MHSSSKPSDGYLSLKEYMYQLSAFSRKSGWLLPLHIMDRVQVQLLKLIVNFSWFANDLYLMRPYHYGIGYDQICNYLNQHLFPFELRKQKPTIQTLVYNHWRLLLRQSNGQLESFALGTDSVEDIALSKAIGEGVERYFTLSAPPQAVKTAKVDTYAALSQLKPHVYLPRHFHTYTDIQVSTHSVLRLNDDQPIEWVYGTDLASGKRAYLPKQLISRKCQKILMPKEGMLQEMTTSGAAGWFTRSGATYRAVLELIERDAFMVAWLTKKQLPALTHETIKNEEIQKILHHFKAAQAEVLILKAPGVASVPTVIVLVFDKGFREEQVYVTAHANTTLEKAILGGLQEALVFFTEKKPYVLSSDFKPFLTSGIGRTERLNLCHGKLHAALVRRLHAGTYIDCVEDEGNVLSDKSDDEILYELVRRLTLLGEQYRPYAYEFTHKALKTVGFHVVKCFVPALFPLYLHEHFAPIKSHRLGTFDLEYEEIIEKLENVPHPFP